MRSTYRNEMYQFSTRGIALFEADTSVGSWSSASHHERRDPSVVGSLSVLAAVVTGVFLASYPLAGVSVAVTVLAAVGAVRAGRKRPDR